MELAEAAVGIIDNKKKKKRNQFDELRDLIRNNQIRLKEDIIVCETKTGKCVDICNNMETKLEAMYKKM